MRKQIPFTKYTAYGNNFVIIDEVTESTLSEIEKSGFAYQATNICFGIGCDNLLVVQRCTQQTLAAINAARNYWAELPAADSADFIFRMFEPDGSEALCCGNGLMSIASFLYQQYGIDSAHIMTEMPLANPNVLPMGFNAKESHSWVNLGQPRRVPNTLIADIERSPRTPTMDYIKDIKIEFRSHDLRSFSDETSLLLSGYLVFTGEPHLVFFANDSFSLPVLSETLFNLQLSNEASRTEKRTNFGTWLIDHIGNYINKHYQDQFPAGVNINFADVNSSSGELMYRCFERGINRETLACGTGALAVCYVAKQLAMVNSSSITIQPHRCSWHEPDAKIRVDKNELEWTLNGTPLKLLTGVFAYGGIDSQRRVIHAVEQRRLMIRQQLRNALQRNEFTLDFQPQISSANQPVGVEALLRWRNDELGIVTPQEFIPIAEETGLIQTVGEWVLQQACAQVVNWQEKGFSDLRAAVNLSSQQLLQKDFLDIVYKVLSQSGLKANHLEFEIDASALQQQSENILPILHGLKDIGVGLAMDNFGKDNADLSYLRKIPINRLKLDRSFTKNVAVNNDSDAFATTIITMAHRLQLIVTAEGVETKGQRILLSKRGCDELQGFLFGQPQSSESLSMWLHNHQKEREDWGGKQLKEAS